MLKDNPFMNPATPPAPQPYRGDDGCNAPATGLTYYGKRFAPVAPIGLLEQLHEIQPELLGSYHLLLAHDIVSSDYKQERFRKLFCGYPSVRHTIIVDNSVIETNQPVELSTMIKAVTAVSQGNQVYVSLPDILMDGPSTINAIEGCIDSWHKAFSPHHVGLVAIPQGTTEDEFYSCTEMLAREYGNKIAMWGIAKNFVEQKVGPSRYDCCEVVDKITRAALGGHSLPIHLLGFSDDLRDDVRACSHRLVQGIDSAAPLHMGWRYDSISLGKSGHGKRSTFWTDCQDVNLDMIRNIRYVRSIIQS